MVLGTFALAVGIVCSACSGSTDVATLRHQVDAIFRSTNAQLAKDQSKKDPAGSNAKYAAAFRRAADQFAALNFPTSMQHDANALVKTLRTMSSEATAVSKAAAKNQTVLANVKAMAQLNLKLIEEEKTEKTLATTLRDDLGLPPETTTSTTTPPATVPPTTSTTAHG